VYDRLVIVVSQIFFLFWKMSIKFFAILFLIAMALTVSAEKGDHERFVRSGSHEYGYGSMYFFAGILTQEKVLLKMAKKIGTRKFHLVPKGKFCWVDVNK
jgi:hypothetical protein